ncbi:MAG: hypothetical protein LAT82_05905 [Nanoarchaeota archaeon]|nr:hypothetical protein [Nanoarchaeota archaeon]
MSQEFAKSIDKEASIAFKKVKYDIEELRRLVNTKQDKQDNVLLELNKTKSELRIEFKEDMLELQKTMDKEINTLRKEVLYYRELCENYRKEVISRDNSIKEYVHKQTVVHSSSPSNSSSNLNRTQERENMNVSDSSNSTTSQREFHYKRIVAQNPEFQPTPSPQEFDSVHSDSNLVTNDDLDSQNRKTYLKWITVGDSDLDSIDEVYVR